jgi:hypothetical protein
MRIQNRRRIVGLLATVPVGLLAACQSPPATPEKPAAAAVSDKLVMYVDIVQGSKNVPADQAKNRACVSSSRFPRNAEMVFRMRITDPKTGDFMDDKLLKGVAVELSNGTKLDGRYGMHPKEPPNEGFWTTSWLIPKDHATGTLKYVANATAIDGRLGKFEPMIGPAMPAVLEDVMADVAVAPAPAKPKP